MSRSVSAVSAASAVSVISATLALVALLGVLSPGASAQVDRVTFYTHMTPDQAVPPSESGATAEAEFVLDLRAKQMTYRVVTQCVGPVPTLQVGIGGPGVNGPVLLSDGQSGYDMYEGKMLDVTDATIAALYAGNVYAEITTYFVFTGPEIRGQLLPVQHKNVHVTSMSGAAVIPPTASAATGFANLSINRPDNTITLDMTASGLPPDAYMAEIRFGTPTMTGGPVIAVFGGGPDRWGGTTTPLTPISGLALGLMEQGFTYVTILTNAYPAGEIRGQIRPAPTAEFVAQMNGDGMLPPVDSRATGLGRFVVNNATKVLSWNISVNTIDATAVKLALGTPGQAPTFTVTLPGGPTTWSGALPINDVILDLFNRMKIHVLVTSALHPEGEIRGQIVPNPMRHGFGSDAGSGRLHVGHIGSHTVGNLTWTATLNDTVPGSLAHLSIGYGNVSFNNVSLPLDLGTGAGIFRSYQWIDPTGGLDYYRVTDSIGAASVTIPILNLPSTIGFTAWYQWIVQEPVSTLVGVSDAMKVVVQ